LHCRASCLWAGTTAQLLAIPFLIVALFIASEFFDVELNSGGMMGSIIT